jgi:hypothetical protein
MYMVCGSLFVLLSLFFWVLLFYQIGV